MKWRLRFNKPWILSNNMLSYKKINKQLNKSEEANWFGRIKVRYKWLGYFGNKNIIGHAYEAIWSFKTENFIKVPYLHNWQMAKTVNQPYSGNNRIAQRLYEELFQIFSMSPKWKKKINLAPQFLTSIEFCIVWYHSCEKKI